MTNTTNNTTNNTNATMVAALIRNTPTISGVRYLSIPLELLEVHPTVQRQRKGHERKIAAAWDNAKCGTILVSYRDNRLLIIDGQHRYWAAQMLGHDSIPCAVIECQSEAEEALLFARQDDNKVRLTTVEKVRALCIGNDSKALALKKICDKFNLVLIPKSPTDAPRLTGIRAAEITLARFGEKGLKWALSLIEKANWRDVPNAYGEDMLVSLRQIYAMYGNDDTVKKTIAREMKRTDYIQFVAKARTEYIGCSASRAMSAYMHDIINRARSEERSSSSGFEVVA